MQQQRQKTRAVFATCFMLMFAVINGCKKTDSTTGITNPGSGTITVGFTSLTAQAATGTPATIGVTLARSTGYTGSVALAAEGLPAGVTASFDPAILGATTASSILTVTVGSSAVAGLSTVTVRGTAAGATSATATILLTVGVAGINFATTTPIVTATKTGAAAIVPLTIDRVNSYAGSVSLTADSLPAGVTATFTPALLSGTVTASSLTLTALSTSVAGTTPVTIRAAGNGIADKTIVVQLTVKLP